MDEGIYPIDMKGSIISPNHKPGAKKSVPASWRPISHTSQISLIFEKILKNFMMNHLENFDHLGDFQYGFRKSRSCLAQLMKYYDSILESLEQ